MSTILISSLPKSALSTGTRLVCSTSIRLIYKGFIKECHTMTGGAKLILSHSELPTESFIIPIIGRWQFYLQETLVAPWLSAKKLTMMNALSLL